ncbi:MAG: autotransporter outer membrane beta-barrel domain-containing protein [Alphaproteobacteria bacterium]|jgi:hypothetical protein|nr:autotransporter outer membrane beta-barrel domain-containing protein [Alphaproteobacteria bacterium]
MWRIFLQIFLMLVFVIIISSNLLKADCTQYSAASPNIECNADNTTSYLNSFNATTDAINIIPTYPNGNFYTTIIITGININTPTNTLNLGTQGGARVDMEITTFNKKVAEQTINIYGLSQLSIKKIQGTSGDLTINGENKNSITVENIAIDGNLYLNNATATLSELNIPNLYINNSETTIETLSVGNVSLNDSNLSITNSGNIDSISGSGNTYFSGDSKINVGEININGEVVLKDNTNVMLAGSLSAESLTLTNNAVLEIKNQLNAKNLNLSPQSTLQAGSVMVHNGLDLKESLLKVDSFEILDFNGNATLDIALNKPMESQGSLTTGIYAIHDINLGSTKINLNFPDTYKITRQESVVYEIMYSELGDIFYTDTLENTNPLFNMQYNLFQGNGTSLVVEITRKAGYCEVLNCGDSFSAYVLKHLEEDSKYENIKHLRTALDNSPADSAVLTLKPISKNMLLMQNYINNRILLDAHDGLSVVSSGGRIKDNIFNTNSKTQDNNVYYQQNFSDNFSLGLAVNKSTISNNLYDVDNSGALMLAGYTLNFVEFTAGGGINKYNTAKSNFNDDSAKSDTFTNSFIARAKLYQDYDFNRWQVKPNVSYTVQYSTMQGSAEKGSGLLYETQNSKAAIGDFNLGADLNFSLMPQVSFFGGAYVSYLTYNAGNTTAKPFELADDYLTFNDNNYSNLGYIMNFGASYKIKEKYGLSLAYTGMFYPKTVSVNTVSATFKYEF